MLVNDIDEHDAALQVHKLYGFRISTEDTTGREHKLTSRSPAPKKPAAVNTLLYHPATKRLYVGLDNGELRFWKLGSECASSSYLVGVHKGAVACVYIPHENDGDLAAAGLILSGSYDATIKLWDYQGKITSSPTVTVQTLYGHGGTVTCMATNGDYIISGSTDCTIRLWKAEDGRRDMVYPWFELQSTLVTMEGWVRCMVFRRPKDVAHVQALYAADDAGGIIQVTIEGVIDPETCRAGKLKEFRLVGRVAAPNGTPLAFRKVHDRGVLAISHDVVGDRVCTLAYDNGLRVYDTASGACLHAWSNENRCLFSGLHYEPAVKQVVTVDQQGFMAIYSLASNSLVASKRLAPRPLTCLTACLAPNTYAVACAGDIQIWKIEHDLDHDVARGGHTKDVIALYACSGGLGVRSGEKDFRVLSASVDNSIRLWDPYDMSCMRVMEEVEAEISSMTFFEGWNTIATGHESGDIRLWNMDTGNATTLRHHTNTVSALVMAIMRRNEELLISASYDGLICIWDIRSMRFQQPHLVDHIQTVPKQEALASPGASSSSGSGSSSALKRLQSSSEILCLEYDPVKKLIFSGGNDNRIKVWSALSLELCGLHCGHRDSVTCLTLDGNFLFSGSEDTTIHMWDVIPAGSWSSSDGSSYLCTNLGSDSALLVLRGHERAVSGVRVHQVRGHLISCSVDGELRLWSYTTGQLLHTFRHHEQFRCMAVRYDKDEVLVGTSEANILRFPLAGLPAAPHDGGRVQSEAPC